MHSIKHQARNIAWRYGKDDYINYNPFAKRSRTYIRSHPLEVEDGESGLHRVQTDPPSCSRPDSTLDENAYQGQSRTAPATDHHATSTPRPSVARSHDPSSLTPVDSEGRELIRAERTEADCTSKSESRPAGLANVPNPDDVALSTKARPETNQKGEVHHLKWVQQCRCILSGSWVHLLFGFVPAGFAVRYAHANAATIFCINFIAIFPSATLLAFAVDELEFYVGDQIGALLSMTSSNAVQLITSVLLLKTRQIQILRVSLIGAILNNLLLTTGLSFFMGGLWFAEQEFNAAIAQTISMLLLLATISLTIPTTSRLLSSVSANDILTQSRGTSVIVLISYALWVLFQLKTHRHAFDDKISKSSQEQGTVSRSLSIMGAGAAAAAGFGAPVVFEIDDRPLISATAAIVTMAISTTLLAFNSTFATDSIQGLLQEAGLTSSFVGIAILPLLGIDPTSIVCAIKDKMDVSIALTLERCMQTSLVVVPIIVLLAWCMDIDDMTLEFDGFIVAALFASIIIVTYIVQEGRSNWLTGALLIKVFIIISLAAFFIE